MSKAYCHNVTDVEIKFDLILYILQHNETVCKMYMMYDGCVQRGLTFEEGVSYMYMIISLHTRGG